MTYLIKIVSVSYANAIPFVFGIRHSGFLENYFLEIATPAECAKKFFSNQVDIALLPIGAFLPQNNYKIISDLCIGADGKVGSVALLGYKKISEAKTILLDLDSKTSVLLVKILAKYFWKINPVWVENVNVQSLINKNEHLLAIGDKVFELRKYYPLVIDLADEWKNFSGFSFTFAVWVANKNIPEEIINNFNKSLQWGCENKIKAVTSDNRYLNYGIDLIDYINNNISYELDENKKKGMNLFFQMVRNV
ncbi:MAG TPA: menaquinone biosynthesis protein [Bacteroidales bacterium]|nr:menaquinone biosynthesis protein [Bacteroidales bacterium]